MGQPTLNTTEQRLGRIGLLLLGVRLEAACFAAARVKSGS
jgi:hypothetical protein